MKVNHQQVERYSLIRKLNAHKSIPSQRASGEADEISYNIK